MRRIEKLARAFVKQILENPNPKVGYYETYVAGYEQALTDAMDAAKCLRGAKDLVWVLERLRDSKGNEIDFTRGE